VVGASPGDYKVEKVDPTTGVTGIKWNVEAGDITGEWKTYSFTLDVDLPAVDGTVAIKGGGQGANDLTGKSGAGTLPVPNCECLDYEDPFWDGEIETPGGGIGMLMVSTPAGLKKVELDASSTNVLIKEIQDEQGNPIAGFTGSGETVGTECTGYTSMAWTGDPADAPASAVIVICAPEQGNTNFFLEITDCCDKTVRVDPALSLHDRTPQTDAAGEVPGAYALQQNYPNPFNPTTSIKFELPAEAQVSLVVYDLMGRVVATLAEGTFEAGTHTASWDGRSAAGVPVTSGIYLDRLDAGTFSLTRRMTLLK
jgi:hypothetical protein